MTIDQLPKHSAANEAFGELYLELLFGGARPRFCMPRKKGDNWTVYYKDERGFPTKSGSGPTPLAALQSLKEKLG